MINVASDLNSEHFNAIYEVETPLVNAARAILFGGSFGARTYAAAHANSPTDLVEQIDRLDASNLRVFSLVGHGNASGQGLFSIGADISISDLMLARQQCHFSIHVIRGEGGASAAGSESRYRLLHIVFAAFFGKRVVEEVCRDWAQLPPNLCIAVLPPTLYQVSKRTMSFVTCWLTSLETPAR